MGTSSRKSAAAPASRAARIQPQGRVSEDRDTPPVQVRPSPEREARPIVEMNA